MAARPSVEKPPTAPRRKPAEGRRFYQEHGSLLILLGLCLMFTIIGPWRNASGSCQLWEQVGKLTLVKDGSLCQPVFASTTNILNLVRQVSVTGIIAVGEMLVILTGGIDLGVGSVVAFSGVIAAALQRGDAGLLPSLALPLAVGAATGLAVGILVTRGRMPSFVVTLGVLAGLRGATLLFTNALPITGLHDDFRFIGTGYLLGIPVPIFVFALVVAGAAILLQRMTLGRYIYAIGGNESAARLSGISVDTVKILVFVLSGFCAALASLILTARLNSGQPLAGDGYELDAIAAVVIGGTSLAGGRGTVMGTVIGALMIGVLSNGLVLMGISPYYQPIIKGGIIVGAVLLDQLSRRHR